MPPLAKRFVGKASPLLFGLSTPYTAFKNAASNIGGLNKAQTRQFHEYCKYLLATQRHKVNISALEDDYFRPSTLPPVPETFPYLNVLPHKHPYQIFDRHFADSLSLIPTLAKLAKDIPRPESTAPASSDASAAPAASHRVSLVDIGAGGGLPGLAIAIARPDWDVTVVDTVAKKCELMRSLASLLKLTNVTVITSRAENLTFAGEPDSTSSSSSSASAAAPAGSSVNAKRGGSGSGSSNGSVPLPRLRERFDFAISRAVASYDVAAEFSMPFVRVGGWCLSMKTRLVTSDHVRAPEDTDATWATRVAALNATSRLSLLPAQLEAAVGLPWKPKPHSLPALAPLLAAEADAARDVVARLGGETEPAPAASAPTTTTTAAEGEDAETAESAEKAGGLGKGVIKYVYLDPVCEVDAATGDSMGVLSSADVDRAVAAWEKEKRRKKKAEAKAAGKRSGDDDDDDENDDDDDGSGSGASGDDIPSNAPSAPRAPVADPDCLLLHYLWCTRKARPTPSEYPRLDIKPATKRGPSEAELERRAEWLAERKAAAEQRKKLKEKKNKETGTAKSAWARKRMEDKAALAEGKERGKVLPPIVPRKGLRFGPNGPIRPAAGAAGAAGAGSEGRSRPGHNERQVKRSSAAE